MGRRQRLREDEAGAFSLWTVVQILVLIIIPVGLFIFWYQYLRRIADDQEAREGPLGARSKSGLAPATPADITLTCRRCGLKVKPAKGGPATCPNCMNLL